MNSITDKLFTKKTRFQSNLFSFANNKFQDQNRVEGMWGSANTDTKPSLEAVISQSSQQPQVQTHNTSGNATTIYTSIAGQTAAIIPASAIQSGLNTGGTTVHLQPHAQIVHHGGNAYLVQSANRLEEESPNLSHTTKASPVTVQWLCENYETADGVSLPRSTLYNHYLQHCQQEKLEPMNQASFGKLIRSVFYGLRTRRLGTRGNSKYHYYGIRIKPSSALNHYVEDQTFALRHYPSFHRNSEFHWRGKFSNGMSYGNNISSGNTLSGLSGVNQTGSGIGGMSHGCSASSFHGANNSGLGNGVGGASGTGHHFGQGNEMNNPTTTNSSHQQSQHSNYLGESTSALPNLGDIVARAELDSLTDEECAQEGVTMEDINLFCQMYLEHSDAVLSAVVYLNFKYIESLWQDFWRTSGKTKRRLYSLSNYTQPSPWEEKLPKMQLFRLLRLHQIQKFLQLFDNMFYQSVVEVLIPNVLRPIPSALTQNIRHFAKSLEGWMEGATNGLPGPVVRVKMSCVCALAQTLRRHTSLNHLAQAARAVLKNQGQITQMLNDLNRVDFGNVQEQASWVCGCEGRRVDQLQQDFKQILQQQVGLEDWADWLNRVVSESLEPHRNTSRYPSAAHQFILRWSFYSSLVIRDLTLRSAASFGSFHLIRLLYDEYIYYLVEQKVAEHLDLTPVAVTGEMGRKLMNIASPGGLEYVDSNCSSNVDPSISQNDVDNDRKEPTRRFDSLNNGKADNQMSNEKSNDKSTPNDTTQNNNNVNSDGFRSGPPPLKLHPSLVPHKIESNTVFGPTSSSSGIYLNPISTSTPVTSRITSSSGIRKTVNVTTFGDPTPTTSSSSSSNNIQTFRITTPSTLASFSSATTTTPSTPPVLTVSSPIRIEAPLISVNTSSTSVTCVSTNPPNKRIKLINNNPPILQPMPPVSSTPPIVSTTATIVNPTSSCSS